MSHHIISLLFRFHSLLILSELFLFRTPPIAAIPFHFVSFPDPSPQRLSLSHHFTSQLILLNPRLSLLCRVVSCPFRTLLFQFVSIRHCPIHFNATSIHIPSTHHSSNSRQFTTYRSSSIGFHLSEISSHVKRPLPLLCHCPMPFNAP